MSRITVEYGCISTTNPDGGELIFHVGPAYIGDEDVGLHIFVENEAEILDCLSLEEWAEIVEKVQEVIAARTKSA